MTGNALHNQSPRAANAAVAVAAASVVALDPGGWFPFSVAKWPAVLTFALLAGAIALWESRGWPAALERRAVMLWSALLALVVFSAVVGLDGSPAWFGTPVRHLGALTWMVFAVLFAVGCRVGSDRVLIRGVVVVGGVLGAYTAWEIIAGAPVAYVTDSSRAGGPYGSAAYLGAACCLFLPISVGVASARSESTRWRAAATVVAVLLIAATLASGTRGAVVALVLTGGIVAGARMKTSSQQRAVMAGRSAILVAASAGAVIAVGLTVAVTTGVFERTAPFGSRLDEWRLGLQALADRPLVGFGPEGYRLVVDRSLSAGYVRSYGDAVLPDRAHNAVLDVALSSGVLAALAYLTLLVVVVAAAWRLVRHGDAARAGLGAASLAFVVQQQFLFPVAEIDAVFWIVAGATVAAAQAGASSDGRTGNAARLRERVWRVAAVGMAAAALVTAVGGVRSVAADRLIRQATESADVEQSIRDAERAVVLDGNDIRLHVVLARSFERRQTLTGVDLAIESIDDALAISPLDPTGLRERARLASLRASITGTPTDRADGVARWQSLVDLAPNCASCQRFLGLTYLEAGDTELGVGALKAAADLGDERSAVVLANLAGG